MIKQLFETRHKSIGIIAAVATLAILVMLTLTGCTSLPDVKGMSPYEAKQQIEQKVSGAQIDFVTIKGTDVTVENSEHYPGWEVADASAKDGKNILVTIRMSDLETEKRNTAIADHIKNEAVSGWPEGSITYYDSDELLTFRYQGEGGASFDSKLNNLAKKMNGTILATHYTDDNYLEAIHYYAHEDAPSDQLTQAEEETARMVEEADLYAAQHLDGYMSSYIRETFPPDFGNPPIWNSANYVLTDMGVTVKVAMGSDYTFSPTNVATPHAANELIASWQRAATAVSLYTQTGVRFEFYKANGELDLAASSDGIKGYDVWNQAKSTVPLPQ